VAHGFRLLETHDREQEMILQPHSLSHKEYVTFGDDKKGKVWQTPPEKVGVCLPGSYRGILDEVKMHEHTHKYTIP
jgi:hypothetical protein